MYKIKVIDSICGTGKAQTLDSLILSENGYIKMRDISINDKVYGEDGILHNVIGIYPQGMKEVYEVTFNDNKATECCNEHLWTYKLIGNETDNDFKTKSLQYILDRKEHIKYKVSIPLTKAVEFTKKDLYLNPYSLGKITKTYVPNEYKNSTISDRVEFLNGLIDIDKCVDKSSISYSTTSQTLALDIEYIIETLGGICMVSKSSKYYLHIKLPKDLLLQYFCFSNYHEYTEDIVRYVVDIKYVGHRECQCILVDNPSHLYLTNNCIVTHNTTALINHMNSEASKDKKFLYITPFLSEVERVKKECSKKEFKDPRGYGSKISHIKYLLKKGENIVSTHSLFRLFDEETIDLTHFNNYTLIMDEVADVVEVLRISSDDSETLLEKYTEINKSNQLIWTATSYKGEFEKYKRLCDLGCVSVYSTGSTKTVLLWMFPVSVFKAFKDIYISTYLFSAQIQKYYYDFHNIEYEYIYIKDYELTNEPQSCDISVYRNLINICEHDKLNSIGDLNGSLSNTWFLRNFKNPMMKALKNNCTNFFNHITKTSSGLNMWTTFKEYRGFLKGNGYSKGFISLNMRATNDYVKKESIAYLANRYINPIIRNFFTSNNIEVDEDLFALSELLQFIFRSKLRLSEPINLYIPSKRMRTILKKWLENNF